jgi:hypothetical protein
MSHLPTCIALASILLFSSYGAKAETILDPFPPTGTKALFIETKVLYDMSNVKLGEEYGQRKHFCQVAMQTPVHSVHTKRSESLVYVMLEENSKEDAQYNRRTGSQYSPCQKSALVEISEGEFESGINYREGFLQGRQMMDETKKAIEKELLKQGQ